MHNLTQRQVEILRSIIEEYITSAGPVGSETLEKKYNMTASPATIRNEMVRLTQMGYLQKPHSSAGRVPTPKGMKFYVDELMKEKELSTVEEVSLKEQVWDDREQETKCLREVARMLAQKTGSVAIATSENGEIIAAGYANILKMPEFYDMRTTEALLSILEEEDYIRSLFVGEDESDIHVLLGDQLGPRLQGPYGFVYANFTTSLQHKGEIGVIGPARQNYAQVVPMVRYVSQLINEISKGW
jgi:heat-inducible transcriptional repressor